MEYDLYIKKPIIFKVKDENGEEIEIDSRFIFYIEITKELKEIHLTEPIKKSNQQIHSIKWRTRKSAEGILKILDGLGFVQISKKYIICKKYISGMGSDASRRYILITMPSNRTLSANGLKWKNVELKLGRSFIHSIKKHVFDTLISMKDADGNVIFVSPSDIILIKINRDIKIVHLFKPICKNDKNQYDFKWKTRMSAKQLISNMNSQALFQVHKNYIINRSYPFELNKDVDKRCSVSIGSSKAPYYKENTEILNLKIPVGNKYKKLFKRELTRID